MCGNVNAAKPMKITWITAAWSGHDWIGLPFTSHSVTAIATHTAKLGHSASPLAVRQIRQRIQDMAWTVHRTKANRERNQRRRGHCQRGQCRPLQRGKPRCSGLQRTAHHGGGQPRQGELAEHRRNEDSAGGASHSSQQSLQFGAVPQRRQDDHGTAVQNARGHARTSAGSPPKCSADDIKNAANTRSARRTRRLQRWQPHQCRAAKKLTIP